VARYNEMSRTDTVGPSAPGLKLRWEAYDGLWEDYHYLWCTQEMASAAGSRQNAWDEHGRVVRLRPEKVVATVTLDDSDVSQEPAGTSAGTATQENASTTTTGHHDFVKAVPVVCALVRHSLRRTPPAASPRTNARVHRLCV